MVASFVRARAMESKLTSSPSSTGKSASVIGTTGSYDELDLIRTATRACGGGDESLDELDGEPWSVALRLDIAGM